MTSESTTPQWVKLLQRQRRFVRRVAPRTASATGIVPVRDSKNPGGPALGVPATAFAAFVAGVKAGGFDTAA
ncbi:hypothetical protein STANM309S_06225 [Streptomyces tanashiensis]